MTLPRLLGVGGAHIDRRGQVAGDYVAGASNPGTLREEVGGVVLNALRNAVQRGVRASLFSVRGGDAAGDTVARAIATAGIEDLSAVFLDRPTPSYTALVERGGDLIAGLADMGLYELAFPKQLSRSKLRDAVAQADAVLCDANLPALAARKLATLADGKPIFAIAISPAKVVRFSGMLDAVSCLFMNLREARALSGMDQQAEPGAIAAALREQGLRAGVLTAGGRPVTGFDAHGTFSITPPPGNVADETGAGDALAGATVAGLMAGRGLREALREGMAAARLTVESEAAVVDLASRAFAEALALVPKAEEVA